MAIKTSVAVQDVDTAALAAALRAHRAVFEYQR
jgi:hypothetical protein